MICLLGDLAAIVPNLLWAGGHQWRGLLTGVLLLPVLVPATRRALSAEPADAIAGGAQTTPEVVAARGQVASQVPGRQVRGFRKPALVLNPRSGSVQAVRDQLLEAAGRYGVEVREAGTPAELVHEPSYHDDRLGAIDGVLEGMLERDALPVRATFRDGSGVAWDQVLVLFVSNNAYPLTAGVLRVLLPPLRPASGRAAKSKSPAPRRRALGIAPTPEGRVEQVAGLARLGRLLGRVGERQFGPARDEHGRPVAPRQRRSDESDSRPGGRP